MFICIDLPMHLARLCKIAAESRQQTLKQWIRETLANAVSDKSILPKEKK